VTLTVRALDLGDEHDVVLGRTLVEEYVAFTADEARTAGLYDVDLPTLHRLIPDVVDFAGRYHDGAFLVATVGRDVAGGVGLTRHDATTCEMNRLWLRAPYRGDGYGRTFVSACLDHARAIGFHRMVLDVAPYRDRAIALYRSLGFVDAPALHEYPFEMVSLARAL
jgi:GNAT superfamily N-acetyltransferase